MLRRREFLGALGAVPAAAAAPARFEPAGAARAVAALLAHDEAPEAAATDEDLWSDVQRAYTVDRSALNLNNGGVSPAPRPVQEAVKRYLDFSHLLPAQNLWKVLDPQKETVRAGLARAFGADPDEIAITRNASEGLQTCQLGLDLAPGDEVLTTAQDYPRMLTTFRQRVAREGIRLVEVRGLPVPCEDPDRVVRMFEERVTERTRLLLVCHVVNLTGQILPVRDIVRMARRRGVPVVVDGAHAFAQLDFRRDDLECDYYATSLHKWLGAPHGTGMLYVRRERIPALWPLMAAPDAMRDDVRKFEEIGTHPMAQILAVTDALLFHEAIGAPRREARLRYLRDRWAHRLLDASDRVRILTSLRPEFSCAIGTVAVEGLSPPALQRWLWEKHHILVTAIDHPEVQGLRVSPNVYTSLDELDRFCEAVEDALRNGIPS